MTLAATFLGGARSRLLPASIPFRFFAAAIAFHIAGWVTMLAAAPEIADFSGGLGLPLAALHLMTIGVLTVTAAGAALQLLPVATRRPLPALWPARAIFWLLIPGVIVIAHGMAAGAMLPLLVGGAAVSLALVLFGAVLIDNLRRAGSLPLVSAYGWLAAAALFAMAALGLLLVVDVDQGFLADRLAVARTHIVLAAYGFMGMLVVGFSYILVPMFALSPAPNSRHGWLGFATATAALTLAAVGAASSFDDVVLLAAVLGLISAFFYLRTMRQILATRMRKRMGLSFLLIRVAWTLLPLSILLGMAATYDLAGPRGPALFGFSLIFGWLLTFLLGVLQRILPFLASMHGARRGGKTPLVSELTAEAPLKIHAACHLGALILIATGIAFGSAPLIQIGAVAGIIGALAFAGFGVSLFRRLRRREPSLSRAGS